MKNLGYVFYKADKQYLRDIKVCDIKDDNVSGIAFVFLKNETPTIKNINNNMKTIEELIPIFTNKTTKQIKNMELRIGDSACISFCISRGLFIYIWK